MAEPRRKKRRLKFRGEIVFLSFLLSFILCFIAYVNGVKEEESKAEPVINTNVNKNNDESKTPVNTSSQVVFVTEVNEAGETVAITDEAGETVPVTDDAGQTMTIIVTEQPTTENIEATQNDDAMETVAETKPVSNPVAESARKEDLYLDKCVFVGDSISTGFSGYGFVSEKNVFAKTSMRIDLINNTPLTTFYGDILVSKSIQAANPENVYIMLGSNGMGWIETSKMIADYSTFIDEVKTTSPNVNIYVMSIPPVTAEREQIETVADGKILNSQINEYNAQLLTLANEKSVNYIDVNSAIVNSEGMLPTEVSTDGMHFNKETYVKIIDYILTHTVG